MKQLYVNRYIKFIEYCKSINKNCQLSYSEKHHIIPRCLGGLDTAENIVSLSARQHFIAHFILAKAYGGTLWFAYMQMASSPKKLVGRDYKVNSRLYQASKVEYAKVVSKRMSGRTVSDETKEKLANTRSSKITMVCTKTDNEIHIDKSEYDTFIKNNKTYKNGRSNKYKDSRKKSKDKITKGSLGMVTISGSSEKITKEQFDKGGYNGVTKGLVPATNKSTGEINMVTKEEFHSNDNLTHHRANTVIVYDTRKPNTKSFCISQDDPLYISGIYINVGKAQGLKQKGKNNPNCTGMYVTPHGNFFSQSEFHDDTGLSKNMLTRCKSTSIISNSTLAKCKDISSDSIGMTWEQLGWSFVPKSEL